MPKFLFSLFMVLNIPALSYAGSWESINGPTKLAGVVLMAGSDNIPLTPDGRVQHSVVMVIKEVISGQARVDYSLAFSYKGSPEELLQSGDIIKVSFEANETLSNFSAITKVGNIFKTQNKLLPRAMNRE